MEKYGFVYIWLDKKHKRYYVGCHWGREDDGYICSSSWMLRAYRRRPLDFRRRIISRVYADRLAMMEEEHRWLSLIPSSELGRKYYNIRNHYFNHWTSNTDKALTVKQKLSASMKARHQDPEYQVIYMAGRQKLPAQTQETRNKRRESMMGKNVGIPKTEAFYEAASRRKGSNISEAHREKIRAAGSFKTLNTMKRTCSYCGAEANPGTIGRYHNEKCKKRMI